MKYDVLGLIAIEIEVNPVINYEEVDINFLREMSSRFSALAAMTFNIEVQNMEINYNEICKTCEVEALEVKASFTIFHLKRGQFVTVYNRNLQKEQTGYVSEQFIKDSIEHEKKHVQIYMNASQGCTVQIPVMYNVQSKMDCERKTLQIKENIQTAIDMKTSLFHNNLDATEYYDTHFSFIPSFPFVGSEFCIIRR